jgi:mycoredoxin
MKQKTAKPKPQQLQVYSTTWCGDCRRSKRFLDLHQIPYDEINIEEHPEAAQVLMALNNGMRSVPTIIFPDGSILVEPSNLALAKKLGLEI